MKSRILIIDDDNDFSSLLAKRLSSDGAAVSVAGSSAEGLSRAKECGADIVLLDVVLPDGSGVDLIPSLKDTQRDTGIIMISGHGDTNLVVDAMKAGASDYIRKPIEYEILSEKIAKLEEIRSSRVTEEDLIQGSPIIGKSSKIRQLIREIGKVAGSDAPVLLRGESGTGKSLIAEVIHGYSPRKNKPFVTINCPAIPENLLESELFGHEKGAFTGAVSGKMGKFEYADGGTIFLDEIGDLSLDLQAKLLRILQNGEFERVGGLKTKRVDVRIIAATNRNLEEAIANRYFREDLFYRLNVLPVYISPLREHMEDIPIFVEHYLVLFSRKANKHFEKISEDVIEKLKGYQWPGNVRELQNVVERAVIIGKEPKLRPGDFVISGAPSFKSQEEIPVATISVNDIKYQAITRALEQSGGNMSKAAKILGIGRDTLYRRMKKYNISIK